MVYPFALVRVEARAEPTHLAISRHGVLEGFLGRRRNLGWNLSAGH